MTKATTTSIARLKRLYAIIVVSILFFLAMQQYLLHLSISKSKAYSTRLNSAGRQRMFSQRIAKLSLLYTLQKAGHNDLEQAINSWNNEYEMLLHGDKNKGIAPPSEDGISLELQKLSSAHTRITNDVNCLLSTTGAEREHCLESILLGSDEFMAQMEKVVSLYDTSSQQAIQNITRMEYLMTLVAVIVIFLEVLFVFRPTRRLIAEQEDALQQKIKDLTDSIIYAKKVQDTILPSPQKFSEHFPDSFVLYIPKDIVAGDFYLIEQMKEETGDGAVSDSSDMLLFAVGDCTGHGVPGAMVSLICHNAMEKAIREKNMTNPAEILNKVNELVKQAFSRNDSEVLDGMDMSLCCLNRATHELSWAGANIPLWIVRTTDNQTEVIELKPDKQPIGQFITDKPFTGHTIRLQKNDCIYLFSDGYSDQFGGESGKKFRRKQLRDLLVHHNSKTLASTRQALYTALEAWKGKQEQVDDITVIGLRC